MAETTASLGDVALKCPRRSNDLAKKSNRNNIHCWTSYVIGFFKLIAGEIS